ncbi:hypothetical protein Aab01nite_11870 [Paractinoplanes abujensis]|uniref:Uncharacterized protein n=1 Tax=Paractinoplanes abujensis TaxID=882441 RepID=A0A7W7CLX7_9ACTN|nr:hypothetical protein [Actinoplanes abujensis]MBB4690990.1 hypothetical protein [Actinoplanes abujensis]GID17597.1 hypothetical protein Aab01nite_11870 [Actinoplanes abujensis]
MDVHAYLARIDLTRPLTPDAAGSRESHRTVPFKNLSERLLRAWLTARLSAQFCLRPLFE